MASEGSTKAPAAPVDLVATLKKAGKDALGGGLPGAAAMAVQVLSLMWLRTTMNYQYRHGTSTTVALKTLYKEGGVIRFYRGLAPALVQGPMSRFGDTAANAGAMSLLDAYEQTRSLPVMVKTGFASTAAAAFRIALMPVDTVKTIMQVEGKDGLRILGGKMRAHGPSALFHGALAASAATLVGHYPWFATYNYLQEVVPRYSDTGRKLARNAAIGFVASAVSDTASNSIRVIKTYRQTHAERISYGQAIREVVAVEGVAGLMGRGLKTRLIANGLQGAVFSVGWRYFQDLYKKMNA